MSHIKYINPNSADNSVDADERLWKLQQSDAGYVGGPGPLPGKSPRIHGGVTIFSILKRDRRNRRNSNSNH